ncbi:MAG TPA: CPBP family intramembrane glutamic endopeptidase [Terriglobales bacterium]|nr:CPBP family intramembrane glutamic endopeptidase [Terriglobales bacterium]
MAVLISAALSYTALLAAFWFAAQRFTIESRIGGHMGSAFASFALLMLPYWAFGFGAAAALKRALRARAARIFAPSLLLVPYLVFTLPRGEFRAGTAAALWLIPVGIAALFEYAPPGGAPSGDAGLSWQDVAALLAVGIPVEFGLLSGAWPHPGLGAMPKLLLIDAALYAFLVVRGLDGVGYNFRPYLRDLVIGLREWGLFAPLAIGIGLGIGFITINARWPGVGSIATAWLVTFFFVAVPEELFFRGLLMNLLERRVGARWALLISAAIFGLSHFNKPLPFNWRYVLLASIAGIFYGRAWRDRHRLLASGITHATVDVVWGLWFR